MLASSPLDATARIALIERHLDLPRRVARAIHRRCRDYVELDELVALGNAGLTEAAARFDPAAGVLFQTFAHYRVQGAMLDGLRRSSPLPRDRWRQLVALRAASSYLEEQGAEATQTGEPVTEEHASTLADLQRAIGAIRTMYVLSYDDALNKIEIATDYDPAHELDRARLRAAVADAVATLPIRERELVLRHYWQGKNLMEAGAYVGVTKSGASRIHARALARLRTRIDTASATAPSSDATSRAAAP
jgi:RNA polymerase sigma factor for flagellar operon FliA